MRFVSVLIGRWTFTLIAIYFGVGFDLDVVNMYMVIVKFSDD